jgi:signal transduction histidine kinase
MNRLFDKAVALVCCLAALLFVPHTLTVVVAFLLALIASSLQENTWLPAAVRLACLLLYVIAALFVSPLVFFIPLLAYDCVLSRNAAVRLCWIVPLLLTFTVYPVRVVLVITIASLVSWTLSQRSNALAFGEASQNALRDGLRELSLSLEKRYRGLQEKQDYEVLVATLGERARIAREIHDNVGHLLTRSTLQVEALQIVHGQDPQITEELSQVTRTINEAFETVRQSVHHLHDDAFDLEIQLRAMAEEQHCFDVVLDYHVDSLPTSVGYSLIAIVREALTNVAKHSRAKRVKLAVFEYPAFYQLIVHDNGDKSPLGVNGEMPKTGIGLQTMEERVQSLKGVFRLDYNGGVRVFVSIPKSEDSTCQAKEGRGS